MTLSPQDPPSQPAGSAAPAPVAAKQLGGDLAQIFGPGDCYSVAALDLATGNSSLLGAGSGMVLASLVKLDFFETLLYQHQLSGQPLTTGQASDVQAITRHTPSRGGRQVSPGGQPLAATQPPC